MNTRENDLWQLIAMVASDFHGDRIESIISALSRLDSAEDFDLESLKYCFGPNAEKIAKQFREAWKEAPVPPVEIIAGLRTAHRTAQYVKSIQTVELVWTGPKTGLIPVRNTEQVAIQVIESAKHQLFLASFVFYNADSIVRALNAAINRGVSVNVLLECSVGDGVKFEGLQSMHRAVDKASLFYWNTRHNNSRLGFSMHAKCVVADIVSAFVTSANLTSAAMERNIELGVLIKGGQIPGRLQSQMKALIDLEIVKQWTPPY